MATKKSKSLVKEYNNIVRTNSDPIIGKPRYIIDSDNKVCIPVLHSISSNGDSYYYAQYTLLPKFGDFLYRLLPQDDPSTYYDIYNTIHGREMSWHPPDHARHDMFFSSENGALYYQASRVIKMEDDKVYANDIQSRSLDTSNISTYDIKYVHSMPQGNNWCSNSYHGITISNESAEIPGSE
jgi:hypothetical protein